MLYFDIQPQEEILDKTGKKNLAESQHNTYSTSQKNNKEEFQITQAR